MRLFNQVRFDLIQAVRVGQGVLESVITLPPGEAIDANVVSHSRERTRNACRADMAARAGRKDPETADQQNLGRCHFAEPLTWDRDRVLSVIFFADCPAANCSWDVHSNLGADVRTMMPVRSMSFCVRVPESTPTRLYPGVFVTRSRRSNAGLIL
jgi:hypothetical protein